MAKKNKKQNAATEAPVTEETTATAVAEAPAAPVMKQPNQNGITRPKSGTATGRVWEIADTLSSDKGAPIERAAVMAAGKAEGLNEATIATQYGRWRKFNGLGRAVAPAAAVTEAEDAPEIEAEEEDELEDELEDEDEELEEEDEE